MPGASWKPSALLSHLNMPSRPVGAAEGGPRHHHTVCTVAWMPSGPFDHYDEPHAQRASSSSSSSAGGALARAAHDAIVAAAEIAALKESVAAAEAEAEAASRRAEEWEARLMHERRASAAVSEAEGRFAALEASSPGAADRSVSEVDEDAAAADAADERSWRETEVEAAKQRMKEVEQAAEQEAVSAERQVAARERARLEEARIRLAAAAAELDRSKRDDVMQREIAREVAEQRMEERRRLDASADRARAAEASALRQSAEAECRRRIDVAEAKAAEQTALRRAAEAETQRVTKEMSDQMAVLRRELSDSRTDCLGAVETARKALVAERERREATEAEMGSRLSGAREEVARGVSERQEAESRRVDAEARAVQAEARVEEEERRRRRAESAERELATRLETAQAEAERCRRKAEDAEHTLELHRYVWRSAHYPHANRFRPSSS